ncbi:unnamed protein product [Pleuronectes platessa]|uniref:Uncharacterized protein n=1 Tax=Pleuronectes platessa TaxID=8262 RepID=A0A9N7TVP3_PLEPL|nr:unnamed protein product [Pleuronectes platessa]
MNPLKWMGAKGRSRNASCTTTTATVKIRVDSNNFMDMLKIALHTVTTCSSGANHQRFRPLGYKSCLHEEQVQTKTVQLWDRQQLRGEAAASLKGPMEILKGRVTDRT